MIEDFIKFIDLPENYYAKIDGIMLEAFPAMHMVLERLTSLPPSEQIAWGKLLTIWGIKLVENQEVV